MLSNTSSSRCSALGSGTAVSAPALSSAANPHLRMAGSACRRGWWSLLRHNCSRIPEETLVLVLIPPQARLRTPHFYTAQHLATPCCSTWQRLAAALASSQQKSILQPNWVARKRSHAASSSPAAHATGWQGWGAGDQWQAQGRAGWQQCPEAHTAGCKRVGCRGLQKPTIYACCTMINSSGPSAAQRTRERLL